MSCPCNWFKQINVKIPLKFPDTTTIIEKRFCKSPSQVWTHNFSGQPSSNIWISLFQIHHPYLPPEPPSIYSPRKHLHSFIVLRVIKHLKHGYIIYWKTQKITHYLDDSVFNQKKKKKNPMKYFLVSSKNTRSKIWKLKPWKRNKNRIPSPDKKEWCQVIK